MLRGTLLVTCLAGCGRFDFGQLPDGHQATSDTVNVNMDAAPVVCAVEGAACDDLDICTTSSTCMSGTCVGPAHAPCTVADFGPEFSDTQGANGWYYGAWNHDLDTDEVYDPTSDFEMFAVWAPDGMWRPADYADSGPTFTWAYITWWGGHPAAIPQSRYPTRRWVSDVIGHANLVVHLDKADSATGDGTGLLVYADGVLLLDRSIEFDDAVGFTESLPVELTIGTRLDVLLTFRTNEAGDTSNVAIQVESR